MFLSSRVSCLPSLCSCTVTGAWMCISAFSTTDSSLYRGGGVWVGGHTQRGPSGKMGEAGGGTEWEESLGCQGVTSLDTTSSSPGNRCAPPPPSLSSLLQLVNKTTTQKNTCSEYTMLLSSTFTTCTVAKTEQNKTKTSKRMKARHTQRGKQYFAISNTHTLTRWCKIKICLHKQTKASDPEERLVPSGHGDEQDESRDTVEPELCACFWGRLRLRCTSAWMSGGRVLVSALLSVVYVVGAPGSWCRGRGWGRVSGAGWVKVGWGEPGVRLDGLTPSTQKDWGAEICCFHQPFPPFLLTPALLPLTFPPSLYPRFCLALCGGGGREIKGRYSRR